ncbi:MAG TPA: hypothetical protein VIY86_02345, partial [Pirellulaceae bacterium]
MEIAASLTIQALPMCYRFRSMNLFGHLIPLLGLLQVVHAERPRPLQVDDLFQFQRVSDPQISPDGKWVVYGVGQVSMTDNKVVSHLWMAAVDGGTPPRRLTNADKTDSHPRWSPDGRWILFESSRSGTSQLWVIPVTGGEASKLTEVATGAGTGTWSPDGRAIAFVSAVYPEHSSKPFAESNRLNKERLDAVAANPVKARVYQRLFFRHWDSYVEDKRQHLFVADFDPVTGSLAEPRDVTPGDRDAYPTSTT